MDDTILIVEDQPNVLAGLLEVLQRAGWAATGARTFEEGKRILTERPPALLITDVRLGSFNGLQLAICGRLKNPGMAVLVLTAFPDRAVEETARQHGAEYLLKPVDAAELLTLVSSRLNATQDRVVSGRHQSQAYSRDAPSPETMDRSS